jgi:hypothetical protein
MSVSVRVRVVYVSYCACGYSDFCVPSGKGVAVAYTVLGVVFLGRPRIAPLLIALARSRLC